MTAVNVLNFIMEHWGITLIGTMTIFQISPIKINPWSWIMRNIRKVLVGDLEKSVNELSKEFMDERVNNKRWNILDFANSCRQGRKHTKEEWEHCLDELRWYEHYCEKKHIPNGVMEESAKYLRNVYHERLMKNDFLI